MNYPSCQDIARFETWAWIYNTHETTHYKIILLHFGTISQKTGLKISLKKLMRLINVCSGLTISISRLIINTLLLHSLGGIITTLYKTNHYCIPWKYESMIYRPFWIENICAIGINKRNISYENTKLIFEKYLLSIKVIWRYCCRVGAQKCVTFDDLEQNHALCTLSFINLTRIKEILLPSLKTKSIFFPIRNEVPLLCT